MTCARHINHFYRRKVAQPIRALSVSRSGTSVIVRWELAGTTTKKFRVYFKLFDGSATYALTPTGLTSSTRSYTLTDQSLASLCGDFYITMYTVQTGDSPPSSYGRLGTGASDVQGSLDPCGGGGGSSGTSTYKFANSYHHRDHLGSLRAETDSAGWVTAKKDYYAFGIEANSWGETSTSSPKQYTGTDRDSYTGFDYMLARYCGGEMGRFVGPDPVIGSPGSPQSWNAYASMNNNPINRNDPSGALATDRNAHADGPFDPGIGIDEVNVPQTPVVAVDDGIDIQIVVIPPSDENHNGRIDNNEHGTIIVTIFVDIYGSGANENVAKEIAQQSEYALNPGFVWEDPTTGYRYDVVFNVVVSVVSDALTASAGHFKVWIIEGAFPPEESSRSSTQGTSEYIGIFALDIDGIWSQLAILGLDPVLLDSVNRAATGAHEVGHLLGLTDAGSTWGGMMFNSLSGARATAGEIQKILNTILPRGPLQSGETIRNFQHIWNTLVPR